MNKKTLLASIVFAVVLGTIAIVGAVYCSYAISLLPVAIMPIITWAIRNRKNLSMKFNKASR